MAIKLQCISCYGYALRDSQTCDNIACPFYHLNPYQDLAKRQIEQVGALRIDEKVKGAG